MKTGLFSRFAVILLLIQLNHTYAQTLTQAEYDQFIEVQTNIVNDTKKLLDDPESKNVDASTQRKAFCDRITAYQNIQKVSSENITLSMAPIMQTIAQNYLDRQSQSLTNSGMTSNVFCKNAKTVAEEQVVE